MNYLDYISSDIKALSLNDSVKKAKDIFNNCTLTHLPVVKNNQLIGLLSENDSQVIESDDDKIEKYIPIFQHFNTTKSTIWIDLIKQFASFETNILPVLDNNQVYIGYFDLNDILHQFLETPFLNESGLIIIVEKNASDYSFSEISQIVEANNARLLGAFISKRDNDTVQITLKISEHDINNTLQTFRRYNYNVLAGNLEDKYLEQLQSRSDYLQKYLNI